MAKRAERNGKGNGHRDSGRERAERAVSISNRQFVLLREIADTTGAQHAGVTLERLLQLSQTTSGSVVRRGLVKWSQQAKRFVLTGDGHKVIGQYRNTDITRKDETRPLSSFIKGVRGQ